MKTHLQLWFGKYRGWELEEVPGSYLAWMADNMQRTSLREVARGELRRRVGAKQTPDYQPQQLDPITREMIEAGFRIIAKKYHPDLGGDVRKMQEINLAMERLRRWLPLNKFVSSGSACLILMLKLCVDVTANCRKI